MRAFSIILFLALVACNKPKTEATLDNHQAMATDSGSMNPMAGQSGMMSMMPAHLDSMMRMTPEQMSRSMVGHERMMSEMMDRMRGEMRQMKMPETPEWSALTDSIKQDLAQLPSLGGEALSRKMRAHAARTRRLLQLHKEMMKM
jgi:hypothetical protein